MVHLQCSDYNPDPDTKSKLHSINQEPFTLHKARSRSDPHHYFTTGWYLLTVTVTVMVT